MIEPLQGLPDGVIGFAVSGQIGQRRTAMMTPAVESALTAGGVRLVLVFESFDGMTGGAVLEDLKMGVAHLSAWKRVALVSDIDWMNHLVALFGWMTRRAEALPAGGTRRGDRLGRRRRLTPDDVERVAADRDSDRLATGMRKSMTPSSSDLEEVVRSELSGTRRGWRSYSSSPGWRQPGRWPPRCSASPT